MDDSGKEKEAPSMSALFGSDSEDEGSEHELTHRENTEDSPIKSKPDVTDAKKDDTRGDDEKEVEYDDAEFQDDGITGSSNPRAKLRISEAKTNRYSNNDEYDYVDNRVIKDSSDMLDESIKPLPSRQIVLSEAPSILVTDESDVLSSYALASKSNFTFHLVQLPKIVAINAEQYNASSFDEEQEEDEFQRPVHNMIRWRQVSNPNTHNHESMSDFNYDMESNANIIHWSDGTFGLAIGDEVFELDEFPFSTTQSEAKIPTPVSITSKDETTTSKDFIYLSSKAGLRTFDEFEDELKDNDDPEDRKISTILQCIVPLQSKLIPRPSSIKSAAHKAFILAEKSRSIKRANIGKYVPVKDPELEKAERIRNNEDLSKQKKRYSSGDGRSSYGGGRRSAGQRSNDYDDEKYDSINIKDLKRKNQDMDYDYADDDDEDDEDEWRNRKKKMFQTARDNSKAGLRSSRTLSDDDESDDDENVGNELASDDEDDQVKVIAARKKRSSVFAEDDEDE